MDDFASGMILFNVAVQISKFMHGHMNFIVFTSSGSFAGAGKLRQTKL